MILTEDGWGMVSKYTTLESISESLKWGWSFYIHDKRA